MVRNRNSVYRGNIIDDLPPDMTIQEYLSQPDATDELLAALDDKKLLTDIQKMSAFHIRNLLSATMLSAEEKKIRDQILVKLSASMMPKAEKDTEIKEEDLSLSDEEKARLSGLLEATDD